MSGPGWVSNAPCAGDLRFTPDNPAAEEFTAVSGKLLAVCRQCPYRSRCVDLVLPHACRFDGVCGGRLWLDGRVHATCEGARPDELEEPGPFIPHGTEAGA